MRIRRNVAMLGLLISLIALSFQNCAPVRMSGLDPESQQKTENNGGPYAGLQKIYQYFNSVNPCTTVDRKGQPLSNTAILFKTNLSGQTEPYLARDNCLDVNTPLPLSHSDVAVSTSNPAEIVYKGLAMSAQKPLGDFDVVAASCPVGRTPISGATRTNLATYSLDWTRPNDPAVDLSGWVIFPGVFTAFNSTLQSLPAYLIERNDTNYLDRFRRASQYYKTAPSTLYAYSFLAAAGSVTGADVDFYRRYGATSGPNDESALVTCDFQNLTTKVQYAVNVPPITATISRVGTSYLCTIYFTTSAVSTSLYMDVGVSPTSNGAQFGRLGDSITATNTQMVAVNQFCN